MKDNKYTKMQQNQYDQDASQWSVDNRDPVVGTFDNHNLWKDYDDFLFKGIDTSDKVALDFGCGPGRNIVKFANCFKTIDGVDISQVNLDNALKWFEHNKITITPRLFKNDGVDISVITDNDYYDVVFSTICMQHICVHDIRVSLLKDFYRVLKPGGSICIQMGYGTNHPRTVGYYDNFYDAPGTNSMMDTRVEDPQQLKGDLEAIGFTDFDFDIRPVGPGDGHTNWIFFRAKK